MISFDEVAGGLEARYLHEVIRLEAWGTDAVRARIAEHQIPTVDHGALVGSPNPTGAQVSVVDGVGRLANGTITVAVELPPANGKQFMQLSFTRSDTGEELLAEQRQHFWWPGAHSFEGNTHGRYRIVQDFNAYSGERMYGMGQHSHGRLDHKGLSMDLVQRNGEVNVPFFYSTRGYGFLWNNPAVGQVDFAENRTRWTMRAARHIDYWVVAAETPAAALSKYADVVGHAPELPLWASGMWQSRLRYESQEEILDVARGYRDRGWPLSVIVSDYFHWPAMGDWRFDPAEYPDPDAMMDELGRLGAKLMVSVWPTVSPHSENYEEMRTRGLLVGRDMGMEFVQEIQDKQMPRSEPVALYDATNPAARDYVWSKLKENYFDKGVRVWWLDAIEPEAHPGHVGDLAFFAGPGNELNNVYGRDHARGVFEHAAASGDPETLLLCRSAWAGQAKYAAAVWSGDIAATWDSLAQQVRAGLSMGLSGFPWWTTDIGGFHGGDATDPCYQELFARWFEYGTFCPLMRLHGHRDPRPDDMTGGPNEPWSYGPRIEQIAGEHIGLRERLRPYIHRVMHEAATSGLPPMRPLFLDYPSDAVAWDVDDQFLLGSDLMIAPVLASGLVERAVYLPAGTSWTEIHTGRQYAGGQVHRMSAPYEWIPVLSRDGAPSPFEHQAPPEHPHGDR